jgi:hypothetical protein
LFVTNRLIEISAEEIKGNTGYVARQAQGQQGRIGECDLVRRLIEGYRTRREQIGEWKRLTGKCRRTFELRLRELREVSGNTQP